MLLTWISNRLALRSLRICTTSTALKSTSEIHLLNTFVLSLKIGPPEMKYQIKVKRIFCSKCRQLRITLNQSSAIPEDAQMLSTVAIIATYLIVPCCICVYPLRRYKEKRTDKKFRHWKNNFTQMTDMQCIGQVPDIITKIYKCFSLFTCSPPAMQSINA